jgi:thymidylate kinase
MLASAEPNRIKRVNALQNVDAVQENIRKILKEAGF